MSDKLLALLSADDEAEAIHIAKAWNDGMAQMLNVTGAKSLPELVESVKKNAIGAGEAIKLAQRVSELEAEAQKRVREERIAKLSTEGKAPPRLHDFLRTLTLEQLDAFGTSAPKTHTDDAPKGNGSEVVKLTDEEARAAKAFGMSAEAYTKAKADMAKPLDAKKEN